MDSAVVAAMARWPDVPHVYGWLRLDRRGQWRLRGEVIRHAGLAEFIGRNYAADPTGNWFFQNGPQRVYVSLDSAPWVVRATEAGLLRHNGEPLANPDGALIDEEGSLLFSAATQLALLDDRDLSEMVDHLATAEGRPLPESHLDALIAGEPRPAMLELGGCRLPLTPIRSAELATRFGYQPEPCPGP